jgi:hypothetical protein
MRAACIQVFRARRCGEKQSVRERKRDGGSIKDKVPLKNFFGRDLLPTSEGAHGTRIPVDAEYLPPLCLKCSTISERRELERQLALLLLLYTNEDGLINSAEKTATTVLRYVILPVIIGHAARYW